MYSKNKIFLCFSFSFLLFIFVNNLLGNYQLSILVLSFFGVLFLNFNLYVHKYYTYLIFLLLGGVLGIILSQYTINNISLNSEYLNEFYNKKTPAEYVITEVHKINDFDREYIAQILSINKIETKNTLESVVVIPYNFDLKKGDIIGANSKFYPFQNTTDFAYKNYMLTKNIYFKTYINSFENIGHKIQNPILIKIDSVRSDLLSIVNNLYPSSEAIFLGGILLGARENLPQELKTNFNNSGLTHFIAVSGFNITILVLFFSFLLQYFPLSIRVMSITIFVILFTLLVGFTAPVIRASIMGLIGYYVLTSGRKGDSLSIIILTALIMVLWSPLSLNYDVSLHLSFLAVVGIIYTQDFFKKIFHFLPETLAIKEAFVLTLGALSFTLPIMIFNFGQVSILAPIANIAVTWTIPIAMLLGFISILAYIIFPPLGFLVGYLTWIFLKFDMLMVELFGQAEFAILRLDFGIYKNYLELLYFIIGLFLVMYFKSGQKKEQTI